MKIRATVDRDPADERVPCGRLKQRVEFVARVIATVGEDARGRHLVLGERSGFVGADNGCGADRFRRDKFANEAVLPRHLARVEREADRDHHG